MTDPRHLDPPSPFIAEWLPSLAGLEGAGRALDVATGRGRHAAVLARAGFKTFAIERNLDVLDETTRSLKAEGLLLHGLCADLTTTVLPVDYFDVIVVTRYLQRDLCSALAAALVEGGTLLYETFTEAQRRHQRGPTSPDHLLAPGELRSLFDRLECAFYEEVDAPDAVARLVARASRKRS